MKIGRITICDTAACGQHPDLSGPAVEAALAEIFPGEPLEFSTRLIPCERQLIELTLVEMTDAGRCTLVFTTGGTGCSHRDITPEATRTVVAKELPGFGERMRKRLYEDTPEALLTHATAGIRGRALVINLPGNPKQVRTCLEVLAPAIRASVGKVGV